MAWSEFDPIGERGREATFSTAQLSARLILDCHSQPRKLEISFPAGPPAGLLEALRPFARPVVVRAGELAWFDREGYFRLYVVPAGVRVVLRKAAPAQVVAELLAQLERVVQPVVCQSCVAGCAARALSYVGNRLFVDEERCTACLDCVRHHVEPRHYAPTPSEDEP